VPTFTDDTYCEVYPYVTPAEVIACCKTAENMAEDDDRVIDAIDDASLVIYYLTGKQFGGTCQATVRPPCLSGSCGCGCTPNQIDIGLWPVTDLVSVRYDGVVYTDASDPTVGSLFHVTEHRYLARKDGDAFLSGNQWAVAGSAQDTADNGYTFEVTVEYGLTVPRLVKRAAKRMACELLKACCNDASCKLPERVTSVTRSGLTMDVKSAEDLLRDGRTGIYEVDLAIQVFNPSKLQSPSFVFMPNKDYGRRMSNN
jgi:hypothetical protein